MIIEHESINIWRDLTENEKMNEIVFKGVQFNQKWRIFGHFYQFFDLFSSWRGLYAYLVGINF